MFWAYCHEWGSLDFSGFDRERILFWGLARSLLTIDSNVSFDASALVFIPNSHSCNGSLSILRCAEGCISTHQLNTAITCL